MHLFSSRYIYTYIYICLILGAGSCLWLAHNREVYTRISRLTSSEIKRERTSFMTSHWRSRPPSTFLAAAMGLCNTMFIQRFRPDKRVSWGFSVLKCDKHGIIRYPVYASADTGIYPHSASQYHTWPSAARGIAMLRVDKFPYPRQKTRGKW